MKKLKVVAKPYLLALQYIQFIFEVVKNEKSKVNIQNEQQMTSYFMKNKNYLIFMPILSIVCVNLHKQT